MSNKLALPVELLREILEILGSIRGPDDRTYQNALASLAGTCQSF
jgi:hypothetical protein